MSTVASASADQPMPVTRVPKELVDWLQACHEELGQALVAGDETRVMELSSRLSDGTAKMSELLGVRCGATRRLFFSSSEGSWCAWVAWSKPLGNVGSLSGMFLHQLQCRTGSSIFASVQDEAVDLDTKTMGACRRWTTANLRHEGIRQRVEEEEVGPCCEEEPRNNKSIKSIRHK